MCTSLTLPLAGRTHLFGRTLDLDAHFGEGVTLTPRDYRPPCVADCDSVTDPVWPREHHVLLGMATVVEGYPLYAEAMNDKGLYMAGLRFARNAVYVSHDTPHEAGRLDLAPWELIPYLLGRYENLDEVREALCGIRLVDKPFLLPDGKHIPPAPLHWHIAHKDREQSLVVESTERGLEIYDNPAGVLTNDPPFPGQLTAAAPYLWLTPQRVGGAVETRPARTDHGEALSLPGDYTSTSRFVRAAYLRRMAADHMRQGVVAVPEGAASIHPDVISPPEGSALPADPADPAEPSSGAWSGCWIMGETRPAAIPQMEKREGREPRREEAVDGFFRVLEAVAPPPGAVLTPDGRSHRALYTCCMDGEQGIYYCRREGEGTIHRYALGV